MRYTKAALPIVLLALLPACTRERPAPAEAPRAVSPFAEEKLLLSPDFSDRIKDPTASKLVSTAFEIQTGQATAASPSGTPEARFIRSEVTSETRIPSGFCFTFIVEDSCVRARKLTQGPVAHFIDKYLPERIL